MPRLSRLTWALLLLLLVAVAGITHIVTLLALPWRSPDDAFARLAATTPPTTRTLLPDPGTPGERVPFRDPAMLTAVCRYDLRAGPFRIATAPFAESFVTLGFHSRHGLAFYGLTVAAVDASRLDLVLGTAPDARGTEAPRDAHEVTIAVPEPEGFVTLSTPLGDGSERGAAETRLRQFACRGDAAGS